MENSSRTPLNYHSSFIMKKLIINITWCMAQCNNSHPYWMLFPLLYGCTGNPSVRTSDATIPTANGFEFFYKRFHEDSIYQMNHILFPLEGEPDQSDTIAYTETYYHHPETWVIHKTFNERDTLFDRSFKSLDSTLIIEIIQHRFSPLRMERRWSLNDTTWQLVYYSPLRMPVIANQPILYFVGLGRSLRPSRLTPRTVAEDTT